MTETSQSTQPPQSSNRAESIGDQPEVQAAFAHCRKVTRERARNFFYGLRLAPEPRRSALYAVYAWSRLGDDIADQNSPIEHRREQLHEFRAHTRLALEGSPAGDDPLWTALSCTAAMYPVRPLWFWQMLDGFELDLVHEPFANDQQLWDYCDRVAGTVGRLCVAIWGVRDGCDIDEALGHASLRGRAFQVTNILRDYAEDYDQGRVYLPENRLRAHGLTPIGLRLWKDRVACVRTIHELAGVASDAFKESSALEGMILPDCRGVLWAMTTIYRGVLDRIMLQPELSVQGRASLPGWRKAAIAAEATVRSQWWLTAGEDDQR